MILRMIIFWLLLFIFILFFIPNKNRVLIMCSGLLGAGFPLILSSLMMCNYDFNTIYFQNIEELTLGLDFLNISFLLGLDGFSILFFLLSSFLIFISILFVWDEVFLKEYIIVLLILDLLLLLVFSVLDLVLFYIFFEAILIPMYIMIGLWGSRERKIRAVYLFFFYTLVSSLCMLVGLIYIYLVVGSLNFEYVFFYEFTQFEQYWLWLSFFFSLASKIPMFPIHIWLPEAHVEAPTVGSVLLAGILLKLGVYGFLRLSLNLFPDACLFFSPFIYLLSILGIIYASLCAIRQTDLKRIIAYSSVAHMNLVTMGVFSFNTLGFEGAIIQSISHGFVSGAMFLIVGILYDRYHSRFLYYYGGLIHLMPLYSAVFLIFTLSNIALPGTSSFIGEFLLLLSIYKVSSLCSIFASLGVILCGAYSLWLYNRIVYGNLKINNTLYFYDINLREFSMLSPLLILMLLMGIYPKFFINYIQFSSSALGLFTMF